MEKNEIPQPYSREKRLVENDLLPISRALCFLAPDLRPSFPLSVLFPIPFPIPPVARFGDFPVIITEGSILGDQDGAQTGRSGEILALI